MAKARYKWPKDLAMTSLDIEVPLQTSEGAGLKRPITLRVILLFLASFLICAFTVTSTIIENSIFSQIFFVVGWIVCSVMAIRPDLSGQLGIYKVALIPDCLPKKRSILTRRNSNASDFYYLSDIDSIDEEQGRIRFVDGSFGYAYRVNGSASILVFDDDRDNILDTVANFYAGMGTEYEFIWITRVEAQRVDQQVAAMTQRINAEPDPEVRALGLAARDTLQHTIGTTTKSRSQYLIIKGYTEEGLEQGLMRLQREVSSSTQMISRCTALYDDDLHDLLASLYTYRSTRNERTAG